MAKKGSGREVKKRKPSEEALAAGMDLIRRSPLFSRLAGMYLIRKKEQLGQSMAIVHSDCSILLNSDVLLKPEEWAYVIAHALLHSAFGHFDKDHLPGYDKVAEDGTVERKIYFDHQLWNMACDIYIAKFLADIKFGSPVYVIPESIPHMGRDELQIYEYLLEHGVPEGLYCGTARPGVMDMVGLDKPMTYEEQSKYWWRQNKRPTEQFAEALAYSVSSAVSEAGGYDYEKLRKKTAAKEASEWFINHYPLLGGLATGFKVIEDNKLCDAEQISVAAVNVEDREIYVNPAAKLSTEELRFVLAHEYLHAGLQHHERCQGRDRYLWNVACDYVINGWLRELHVGEMPQDGILYDPEFKDYSAEEIYDLIVRDIRRYRKLNTLRGYGMGDVIGSGFREEPKGNMRVDDFCRSALQQGLEYHIANGRGLLPAGLVQEIRALAMPPIPWDVELGRWFDIHFQPLEARRTYARPSRRQGSTPDIARPRYVPADIPEHSRTFGVVLDTSGSMNVKLIGYALGAIASYSAAKEVPYARVVFCDADAYDAGYISPEDIAGRVEVKGRGGTALQPGVDLLTTAKDFPKDAPILIITDGFIEDDLKVKREHAFLIPKGRRLPFREKGDVFYFTGEE